MSCGKCDLILENNDFQKVILKTGTITIHYHIKYRTELSKQTLSIQDSNTEFSLKWHIKTKAMPYKCGLQKRDLCLAEKVTIAQFKGVGLLNHSHKKRIVWKHRSS